MHNVLIWYKNNPFKSMCENPVIKFFCNIRALNYELSIKSN